jgi:hypothetical protein
MLTITILMLTITILVTILIMIVGRVVFLFVGKLDKAQNRPQILLIAQNPRNR